MGVLLALYWSLLSVNTSSVAKAYFLPLRGLEGAGEGGRSCPSRSIFENGFKIGSFPEEEAGGPSPEPDIVV